MLNNSIQSDLEKIHKRIKNTHNTVLLLIFEYSDNSKNILLECSNSDIVATGCNVNDKQIFNLDNIETEKSIEQDIEGFLFYFDTNPEIKDKEVFYLFYNESEKTTVKFNLEKYKSIKKDIMYKSEAKLIRDKIFKDL